MACGADADVFGVDVPKMDAFELRECGGAVEEAVSAAHLAADRRRLRKKCWALTALVVVLFAASLCISFTGAGTSQVEFYTPAQVAEAIATWFKVTWADLFQTAASLEKAQVIAAVPQYKQVMLRLGVTFVTLVCGALVAVSGMLFQNTFRNPIVSPSLLGVSNGVTIGLFLLVYQYGALATLYTTQRYLYCYVAGALVLVIVLFVGRLLGGKQRGFNIYDMLMVGTVLSSLIGTFVSFAALDLESSGLWLTLYELQEALNIEPDAVELVSLLVATVISMAPVIAMRFGMNLLAFPDEDVRGGGVNPTLLRVVAVICGSLMILTAQIHVGAIAVVALVIPFVSRKAFGVEFRKQLWGNVLIGMALLLLCRIISAVIPFVGLGIPLASIVSIVTIPLFAWLMVGGRRSW